MEEKLVTFLCSRKMPGCVLCFLPYLPSNQLPQTCLLKKKFLKMTYEFWATRDCTTSLPQTKKFYIYFFVGIDMRICLLRSVIPWGFFLSSLHPTYPPAQLLVVIRPDIWAKEGRLKPPTNPTANWRKEASVSCKKRIKMFPELCLFLEIFLLRKLH